jgi:hypothetical protein
LPFQELQKMLPKEVKGMKAEKEAEGQSINMNGMSYAMASQKYTEGDKTVKITIMDYNATGDMFTASYSVWGNPIKMETNTQKTQSFKKEDGKIVGIEDYNKSNKTGNLSAAVGYRFIVTIETTNSESIETAQKTLEILPLKEMIGK